MLAEGEIRRNLFQPAVFFFLLPNRRSYVPAQLSVLLFPVVGPGIIRCGVADTGRG